MVSTGLMYRLIAGCVIGVLCAVVLSAAAPGRWLPLRAVPPVSAAFCDQGDSEFVGTQRQFYEVPAQNGNLFGAAVAAIDTDYQVFTCPIYGNSYWVMLGEGIPGVVVQVGWILDRQLQNGYASAPALFVEQTNVNGLLHVFLGYSAEYPMNKPTYAYGVSTHSEGNIECQQSSQADFYRYDTDSAGHPEYNTEVTFQTLTTDWCGGAEVSLQEESHSPDDYVASYVVRYQDASYCLEPGPGEPCSPLLGFGGHELNVTNSDSGDNPNKNGVYQKTGYSSFEICDKRTSGGSNCNGVPTWAPTGLRRGQATR